MVHHGALEADQDALREAVGILRNRIAVLELRAKGTDEDIKRLRRDLAALAIDEPEGTKP